MAVEIPVQKTQRSVMNVSSFKGIDLTNAPANVAAGRSPNAPNMIRDVPGKVRKRMGYTTVASYTGRVNGRYDLNGTELLHVADKLYADGVQIYSGMKDDRSSGVQINGKIYIFDGLKALAYGEFDGANTVKMLLDIAHVPTVVIGREPTGGGTDYEPINLLSPKWCEMFRGNGSATDYQLSFDTLDSTAVAIEAMNSAGEWTALAENTDFTVDRAKGIVHFTSAPPEPPVAGQDNVKITASKTREGSADKVNKCNICTLYGVNGSPDRIFVSGNPDFKNYDWYSQYNDPTFFGDLWYSVLGQDDSRIVGYSIVNDMLAAHKDRAENGRNVILRKGDMVQDGETEQAAFPVTGMLQGNGAIAPHSFAFLGTEPLFLTELGVFALTPQDTTGERFSQNRSFYIDKALEDELNKADAYGFVYKDMYFLAMNSGIYILDGQVKTYEKGRPYSTYQYECYYWPGLNARVLWESEDGALCFGTTDGKINKFATDPESITSYNDNGQPIEAWWETPDFSGEQFYMNKTVRYFATRLAAHSQTSLKLFGQIKGAWKLLRESITKARYFSWPQLTWSKFSWSGDMTPKTIGMKIKVKKVDKVRFRLYNAELNEPFGIYEYAIEYRESGKYKR